MASLVPYCLAALLLLASCASAESSCVGETANGSCVSLNPMPCDDSFVVTLYAPSIDVGSTSVPAYIHTQLLVANSLKNHTACRDISLPGDEGQAETANACLVVHDIEASAGLVSACVELIVVVSESNMPSVDFGCFAASAAAECGEPGNLNVACDYDFYAVDETTAEEEEEEEEEESQEMQDELPEGEQPWHIDADGCVVLSSGYLFTCPTFYADTCGKELVFSASEGYAYRYSVDTDRSQQSFVLTGADNGCTYAFEVADLAAKSDLERVSLSMRLTFDSSGAECLQTAEMPVLDFGDLAFVYPACGASHAEGCGAEVEDGYSTMAWLYVSLSVVCLLVLSFFAVGAITLAMRYINKRKAPVYITDNEELAMEEQPGLFDNVDDDDDADFNL